MLQVNMKDVKNGMILGEDIYNRYDVLIIASGTIINNSNYKILSRQDLDSVKIINKVIEGKKEVVIVENIVQKRYEETVESFKILYKSVKFGKQIIAEEFAEILTPLLDEIKNNKEFTKKLWQIQSSDEYTYDHSVTVSMASALLGKWLELDNDSINELAVAGLLHDIGKCNIPDAILKKPDKLSEDEFKVMKTHSTLGYIMLRTSQDFTDNVLFGVYQHHERFDGKGYPNNLKGEDINFYARVIAIADVYSAMTTDRVYRERMSPFLVAKLIMDNSFGYLDPELVNIFLNNISNFYVGTIVKLSDGRVGEVVMVNKSEHYRPLVRIEEAYVDLAKERSLYIESLID